MRYDTLKIFEFWIHSGMFGLNTVDICTLEKDVGPCEALIPKYFYNSETGECEQFMWGGRDGNANNFDSFEDCEAVTDALDCGDSGL